MEDKDAEEERTRAFDKRSAATRAGAARRIRRTSPPPLNYTPASFAKSQRLNQERREAGARATRGERDLEEDESQEEYQEEPRRQTQRRFPFQEASQRRIQRHRSPQVSEASSHPGSDRSDEIGGLIDPRKYVAPTRRRQATDDSSVTGTGRSDHFYQPPSTIGSDSTAMQQSLEATSVVDFGTQVSYASTAQDNYATSGNSDNQSGYRRRTSHSPEDYSRRSHESKRGRHD